MSSRSNSVGFRDSSLYETQTDKGKLKCAIIAFVVGGVAGIVIIGIGATNLFGSIGSTGFIASMLGGGLLTVTSAGGIMWIAIANCKSQKKPPNPSAELQRGSNVDEKLISSGNTGQEDSMEAIKKTLKEERDISKALKKISDSFFLNKSQERAKKTFLDAMKHLLTAEVSFPKACTIDTPEHLTGPLNVEVFQLSATVGVQNDIPRSSKDNDHLHVYQVASQYNASEAPGAYTPSIGEAMSQSAGDNTQGPLAQRTNPVAFELVTAFLTHLGFNMLDAVLPSAGTTYENGTSIEHGYLRPTNDTIALLTNEFKNNFSKAEYVCYTSSPEHWDAIHPVHIFLQAAPAIGYAQDLTQPSDELQQYAAFANYLALFQYGIELANKTHQPVVLHATAVGGGVFGNTVKNVQWGFEKAALAFQEKMKLAKVSVQLEAYGTGYVNEIAKNLRISSRPRIGDPS